LTGSWGGKKTQQTFDNWYQWIQMITISWVYRYCCYYIIIAINDDVRINWAHSKYVQQSNSDFYVTFAHVQKHNCYVMVYIIMYNIYCYYYNMVSLVIVFANEAMSFSPIVAHHNMKYYYKWVGHSDSVERRVEFIIIKKKYDLSLLLFTSSSAVWAWRRKARYYIICNIINL